MISKCLSKIEYFSCADAAFSLRSGGVSLGCYASMNLGGHVGDDPKAVIQNRQIFEQAFGHNCVYMRQVHGIKALLMQEFTSNVPECDAIVTEVKGLAMAVMTADCLPLLLCARDGKACAAVHCGWKGLARGIVKSTVELIKTLTDSPLEAYTGPCIGSDSFEVGPEVRDEFLFSLGSESLTAFKSSHDDRLLCSLPKLTELALFQSGAEIAQIVHSGHDTFKESDNFFSYRRSQISGRMVSVIALR